MRQLGASGSADNLPKPETEASRCRRSDAVEVMSRGCPRLSSWTVRRRILLIAIVVAVVGVIVAALVWLPEDQPPAKSAAKRYGSTVGLLSDLHRSPAGCQHAQELIRHYFYVCRFGGGDVFFVVYTRTLVEKLGQVPFDPENRFDVFFKPFFEEAGGDLRDLDPVGFRDFAWSLCRCGIVVGPNWMALSDRPMTLQGIRQAIGGELFMVDSTRSPLSSSSESQ
jgi:hypothetical protein